MTRLLAYLAPTNRVLAAWVGGSFTSVGVAWLETGETLWGAFYLSLGVLEGLVLLTTRERKGGDA